MKIISMIVRSYRIIVATWHLKRLNHYEEILKAQQEQAFDVRDWE